MGFPAAAYLIRSNWTFRLRRNTLDRTIVAIRSSNDLIDLILFEREVGKKNSVGSERMTKRTDEIMLQCAGQVMSNLVDEPWQPNAASERIGWGAQFHFCRTRIQPPKGGLQVIFRVWIMR